MLRLKKNKYRKSIIMHASNLQRSSVSNCIYGKYVSIKFGLFFIHEDHLVAAMCNVSGAFESGGIYCTCCK